MSNLDFDFSYFFKRKFSSVDDLNHDGYYDIFISAFNDSLRVNKIFSDIKAQEKHWLVFPEYSYTEDEMFNIAPDASHSIFTFEADLSEGNIIREYLNRSSVDFKNQTICIDITGFIRPHLIFLVRYLANNGVKKIDFLYSDPVRYKKKEKTDFSFEYTNVRQVDGCHGVHSTDTSNDVLIIGAGYDHLRISDVSKNKNNSTKVQLFGLPSLQADMYQENIFKAYRAEEETGHQSFIDHDRTLFAPANDPFVTANVIKDFVRRAQKQKPITNLYLCPLSTKAQTLGMALYFAFNCLDKPVSIIFPFCKKYSRETTEGLTRIWKYTVEFQTLIH